MTKPSPSTRHFWVLVHRYAGLYIAGFLVVAGLTGSMLSFIGEIHTWLNPTLKVEQQSTPPLDVFVLRERALILVPLGRINFMDFERKPGEAYTTQFEPRTNSATGKPFELGFTTLALNPYTGEEISRTTEPDELWPITRKNFMFVILALHYRLAIPGSVGVWLFGIAAIIWTFDCFVGFFLTLPRRVTHGPKSQGTTTAAPQSWVRRWMQSWKFKWIGANYRIQFNLHRASGLWVWPMLFVFAWSAVALNLREEVYNPVMSALFQVPKAPLDAIPKLAAVKLDPGLDWREAHRVGSRLMSKLAEIRGFKIEREGWLLYDAEHGVFHYGVRSSRDLPGRRSDTSVAFDHRSGKFVALSLPTGENSAETFTAWILYLHMAMVWGTPYQCFVSIMGLVITLLSITGVYLWWKKKTHRPKPCKKSWRGNSQLVSASSEHLRHSGATSPSSGQDLGVFTLVLWLACALIGLVGFGLPYARPRRPAPPEEPVQAQLLQVELTQDPIPPPDSAPPPPDALIPPPPDAITPPPIPQPIAVAQPDPAIAFALPVEGPTRIVDAQRAEYGRSSATNAATAASSPSAQPLTFGQGEGKQAAPDYPRQAVRQGQEGVVVVRLRVDTAGRVQSAEAVAPSPWPLLDESALRTVRERWRFRSGPPRLYDVAIRFELFK